jgi:ATP-dependent Clp protease ATP-binding subunit ClpC
VLLDEIEKAHPDVMHLLLQILEEVKITDSLGQKIEIEDPLAEEFLRREVGLLPE